MAYNSNGHINEEENNWPFSARYTASPYRKSNLLNNTPDAYHNAHNVEIPPSLNSYDYHSYLTPGSSLPYYTNGHNNFHQNNESNSFMVKNCEVRENFSHYQSPSSVQNTQIGLPNFHYEISGQNNGQNSPQYFNRRQMGARNRFQFNQLYTRKRPILNIDGPILDEGYIEELQQTNNSFNNNSPSSSFHLNSRNGDPYSYVYDSQQIESLRNETQNTPSILNRLAREANLLSHQHNTSFGEVKKRQEEIKTVTDENEYEEIHEVASYMRMNENVHKLNENFYKINENVYQSQSPLRNEVDEVQVGHERVLDQLNLDIENLLLSSSTHISNNIEENKNKKCSCAQCLVNNHQHSYSNAETIIMSKKDKKCESNNICHKKSKSESEDYLSMGRTKKTKRFSGGSSTLCPNNRAKNHSSSHHAFLKSLKQQSKTDLKISDENLRKSDKSKSIMTNWKIKEQFMKLPFIRNYGTNDKLRKSGSCHLNNVDEFSSKSSEFPATSESIDSHHQANNKNNSCVKVNKLSGKRRGKKLQTNSFSTDKFQNSESGTILLNGESEDLSNKNSNMATIKLRSSSMDELRLTGSEEHWYSADSDTEGESSLPHQISSEHYSLNLTHQNLTQKPNGSLRLIASSTSNLNTQPTDVIGSKTDPSGVFVPECHNNPKAPKFRRGSGMKEKWRESWSSSKCVAKSSSGSEEESRLLRWFSLNRKNNNSTTNGETNNVDSSKNKRNSTLPLLSEEELKRVSFMEEEEGYWPRRTVLPPTLPPPPVNITGEQLTRRHIVAAIVHSENNYVAALQRLVNEYKKPLECSHPLMLSHSKLSIIFHRVSEILQCHSLFRIALAEYIRKWDTDERIGDVFVASFSKSLVLDVYSEFINNFSVAMETAKSEARRKSAFAEFLKVKQMTAHDRLSLFGLMVKPVQRFPQFILLLQDLLKHTSKDHHDRMSLQLALTQLESLAAMLNERKRESEQYEAFRETIKSISGGKFLLHKSITDDPSRILLRSDILAQIEFENGGAVGKSKPRKLLLLNDTLICVTDRSSQLGHTNTSSVKVGKSVFKWSFPLKEVDIEEVSISPSITRFINGNHSETDNSGGLLEEMQSLMYDYSVLSRVSELVSSLKSSYEGVSEKSVREVLREIQSQIQCIDEEISYFDSSCLTLLLGSNRDKIVFQMESPFKRNEWIEELRLAQLALDPNNSPGWDIPPDSPYPPHRLPLFVKSLSLSSSPHLTTVKCGCYFTHTTVSPTGRSKTLDYLWVSCTDGISSHVTSYRSQQNSIKEISSFDLVEEKINDLIFVAGYVWMGTESRNVMILDPSNSKNESLSQVLLSDSVLKLTLFANTVYGGLSDGKIAVFTDIQNPIVKEPQKIIEVGTESVLNIFGAKDHIYASCGNSVVIIDAKTHIIERNVQLTHHTGPISHMVSSGVGLWITSLNSGTVCLYHLESLQHLQDVSIAPSVFRTVRDSYRRHKGSYVTHLMAHKGWLWIGTNLGILLTIPLPRLEGVPIISTGKANVSYHGHYGPITFLIPLTKSTPEEISAQDNHTNHKLESTISRLETNKLISPIDEEKLFHDEKGEEETNSPSLSASSSFNNSSKNSSPVQSQVKANGLGADIGLTKNLVVLRKKNLKELGNLRNCKTLPRGGVAPSLRFSIDSDVYGLYGNLINVRGLEDEGRFVDPLYDTLRRSDPELQALDARISTLDRRLKMRMSRPRSLDLSNWSVDSKISASSDESVGTHGPLFHSDSSPVPPVEKQHIKTLGQTPKNSQGMATNTTSKTRGRKKSGEKTLIVVVGGKGYVNMKSTSLQHHFMSSETDGNHSPYLTIWQMKK